MPPPPTRHHLEADDVWAVEAEILDGEVLRLTVEDRDASAMSAQCRCHRQPKYAGLPHVKSAGDLGLM